MLWHDEGHCKRLTAEGRHLCMHALPQCFWYAVYNSFKGLFTWGFSSLCDFLPGMKEKSPHLVILLLLFTWSCLRMILSISKGAKMECHPSMKIHVKAIIFKIRINRNVHERYFHPSLRPVFIILGWNHMHLHVCNLNQKFVLGRKSCHDESTLVVRKTGPKFDWWNWEESKMAQHTCIMV